jgi:hypothetical protein
MTGAMSGHAGSAGCSWPHHDPPAACSPSAGAQPAQTPLPTLRPTPPPEPAPSRAAPGPDGPARDYCVLLTPGETFGTVRSPTRGPTDRLRDLPDRRLQRDEGGFTAARRRALTDVGSWITLKAQTYTVEPGTPSMPFSITVPEDAEPATTPAPSWPPTPPRLDHRQPDPNLQVAAPALAPTCGRSGVLGPAHRPPDVERESPSLPCRSSARRRW